LSAWMLTGVTGLQCKPPEGTSPMDRMDAVNGCFPRLSPPQNFKTSIFSFIALQYFCLVGKLATLRTEPSPQN
jgi:hypothetical protein